MKKIIAISAAVLTMSMVSESWAKNGHNPAQGGFSGPTISAMSVAEAKKLSDDTPVVLVGKIEKNLGSDKYSFRDKTGDITIEIDDDEWNGLTVDPNDTVEIRGEIDKDFTSIEVDVDAIVKK